MAIGIVNSDEFESELEKMNGSAIKSEIVRQNPLGRGNGNKAVPEGIKKIIGESHVEGNDRKEIARAFSVSDSSVSAYANGSNSTASYHQRDPELVKHLNKTKDRITKRASRVLMNSLGAITDDSLKEIDPVKASVIARNMGAIIKDMEPEHVDETNLQQNIIFYAPRMKQESEFEVIDLVE